jgi:hypothetical protein
MMSEEMGLVIECNSIGKITADIIDTNPKTAAAVMDALPFSGEVNVWGDEIYFNIPVGMVEENPQQEMEVGDIAFWPVGNAMCIFFGPTPVSESGKPRAYSPVNLFGRIRGDARIFKEVKDGEQVRVKRI